MRRCDVTVSAILYDIGAVLSDQRLVSVEAGGDKLNGLEGLGNASNH